tara:strand:+ start:293 stop:553 length:261 start_codon:yes stop_codon:yes gene_type:complete
MKNLILPLVIVFGATFSSGCSMMPSKVKEVWNKNLNVGGIIERYPQSFNPVHAGTLHSKTDELWYRRNFSGNQTRLLWGLFTLTDY